MTKILVACECSGVVRDAFNAMPKCIAWSCDLKPCERDGSFHYQKDVREVLGLGWDMMIAHPDCTYLTVSGLHWNKRRPERAAMTKAALAFVQFLLDAPIAKIALENPVGCISTAIREPDQIIQPYDFGEDASKKTCLWLKGLPALKPTKYIEPRIVDGKPRWANQTNSGQNKLGPSPTRKADRARTYGGIAAAMAAQWGNL